VRTDSGASAVMSEEKLLKNLMSLMSGIDACLERNLKGPALTLIYSTIDTAGWLDTDQTFTTRQGFINWTEKYLLTAKPLACNAIDLYAARCGLLHTFTPDSQLSVDGKARRLCYAWGTAKVQDIQRLIDVTNGNQKYAAVHVNELYEALKLGLLAFVNDIENDQPRNARVMAKAKKFFSEWDVESVEELITAIDNS
jgi:hypothetical protein